MMPPVGKATPQGCRHHRHRQSANGVFRPAQHHAYRTLSSMPIAHSPPHPYCLYRKKPGTARGTTSAPSASTCQPSAPPPWRRCTSIAIEKEKGSIIQLVAAPVARVQNAPSPTISRPPWPGTGRTGSPWLQPPPSAPCRPQSLPLHHPTPAAAASVNPRWP